MSLPLWERGLKLINIRRYPILIRSLPLWERGLKYAMKILLGVGSMSLPLWERGLKFFYRPNPAICRRRSPCGSVD